MAMYPMTLEEIAAAAGGKLVGGDEVRAKTVANVTMDSRKVTEGSLFVCIKGERTDGHLYAEGAFAAGAVCALCERPVEGGAYVLVESCMDALRKISSHYRQKLEIPVIGIIGSVGKTTTKEMVAAVMSRCYNVLKTPENLNNELGVPLTLLSIGQEHSAAVIEMGISDFGEMTRLSYMVRPDVVVFTNIGYCHLEKLGDLDGVYRAKSEVFAYMDYDGAAVMNGDDEILKNCKIDMQKITYGFTEGCDFTAEDVRGLGFDGTTCRIRHGMGAIDAEIHAFGTHVVYASLAAAAVGAMFCVPQEEIAAGIADYRTIGGRANVIKTAALNVIDDCYNANPNSMAAALRSLATVDGRKVAVLGDMKELNADGDKLHEGVGELARELGIDLVITQGEAAAHVNAGFGGGEHFDEREALIAALPRLIKCGDTVLVKASHSMKFDEIVAFLRQYDAGNQS